MPCWLTAICRQLKMEYNNLMTQKDQLPRSFYARDTVEVARDLLGKRLVRNLAGRRVAGIIIETEAYRGEEDQGCHCKAGRTPRTEVMYGPPGHGYVYFVYGMHWMFNVVTEQENNPGAVLIRGLRPVEGEDLIAERRAGRPRTAWTDGPAKLCQALDIEGDLNRVDLCAPDSPLFLEAGITVPDSKIEHTARIGLNSVPEPWKSIPWRFVISEEYESKSKKERQI